MSRTFRIFDDLAALSAAALRELSEIAVESVRARDRFTLALAGGNTPRALYALLAHESTFPWQKSQLWLGDERVVPLDDPASNAGMVRAALHEAAFFPDAILERVRSELGPEQAAADYEARLRQHFTRDGALPRFDLVLLGLGSDGHTASLFPHAPALREQSTWVTSHKPPPAPARITLTYPVLNNARNVLFLVAGADKSTALQRVFSDQGSVEDVPARGIVPNHGAVLFFADRAAAHLLDPEFRGA